MENKDQLNQIPADADNDIRDEKTSQVKDIDVEATLLTDEVQESLTETTPETAETAVTEAIESTELPELFTVIDDLSDLDPQPDDLPEEIVPEVAPTAGENLVSEVDEEVHAVEASVETAIEDIRNESVTEVETPAEPLMEKVEETTEPAVMVADTEPEIVEKTIEIPASEEPASVAGIREEDQEEEDEDHIEHAEVIHHNYDEMTREELVENLESLVNEEDVTSVKARIALIKVAFLRKTKELKEIKYQEILSEPGDKEEKEEKEPLADALETRFNELFEIYRQKRAVYLENLENDKLVNLKKKQEILDKLKDLISSEETLKKTYDDFRDLQEQWRTVGMVPKTEVNNLWQNYHFLVEKFFDKVKINKELKDLDLKKNLEQKIELCEKVEELLLETSIIKSFRQLQQYHEQWKEIGPVPDDKKDEIWDRFKSTTDKINQRRRDHYKQMQEEQETNLAQKVALCEKAESLLAEEVNSIKGWQERTRQFNDLFRIWKNIGQAPKKQNDEIWDRFKASLDGFFTEKKDYFSKIKEQQVNNYNLKLELCLQAEALKDSDDWRNTSRELIELQKQWKEIGPVPRKYADKIWQRFREACDQFFNKKTAHFSGVRTEESENLRKKEELIAAVQNHEFGTDKSKNLEVLKDYQRQWTEIGFVPFKDKDRLQTAFRNSINKRLDQLNISTSEMSLSSYISRFDNVKGTSDGNRQMQREQNFIQNKITQLREDIMLWENNIGFLADTKNANIFKIEFEKKIEKAKNELSVLETKLKFLSK